MLNLSELMLHRLLCLFLLHVYLTFPHEYYTVSNTENEVAYLINKNRETIQVRTTTS